ncbi:hypothetical protein BGZ97_001393 [Linnemannia gamsii]|uniref:N-acetyltransferase domain-containing protein n=1 Tax=Linnemannia gamsii TaxID=64522 RepID=A0A9P6UJC4_9FUNG|nr:hypothetical protein BGZ97_001393 [Linnemannia gamsii]
MKLQDFTIRNTRPEEVDEFIDILEEAAEWLHSNNIKQWPLGMFRNPASRASMLTGIANKQYFTIDYHHHPSGTGATATTVIAGLFVTNYDDSFDELLWKEYLTSQGKDWKDALYLHRLVLKTPFKGCGLTPKIVEFVEGKVQESGRHFLRLDCLADNERLRRFYRTKCRGVDGEGKEKGGLNELPTVWNPELGLEFARFELQVVPF